MELETSTATIRARARDVPRSRVRRVRPGRVCAAAQAPAELDIIVIDDVDRPMQGAVVDVAPAGAAATSAGAPLVLPGDDRGECRAQSIAPSVYRLTIRTSAGPIPTDAIGCRPHRCS